MSKRRKKNNETIGIVLIVVAVLTVFLAFTNPGKKIISWVGRNTGLSSQIDASSEVMGVSIPDSYTVFGIDVSRYQNEIDWEKVAAFEAEPFSVEFAFIKATEGNKMVDPTFKKNWKEAGKHRILRGAYHYFKPNVDAEKQANHFCRKVELSTGDLPPVLDIEEIPRNMTSRELVKNVLIWLQIVERYYDVKPLLYTNAKFYELHFRNTEIDRYPLWIAHYYTSRPATLRDWEFWQFSDKATVDGIDAPVDVNVFSGNPDQLFALVLK